MNILKDSSVGDRSSADFQLCLFPVLDLLDTIAMPLPDRVSVGVGLGKPQFGQLELLGRVDEAVDRDPAFFMTLRTPFASKSEADGPATAVVVRPTGG